MNNFLDKTGLSYFWQKIKNYVDSQRPSRITVTLSTSGWSNGTQTVTANGVLADESAQLIQPVAMSSSKQAYTDAGVSCISQAANSLTFSCDKTPTSNLSVYIVMTKVRSG